MNEDFGRYEILEEIARGAFGVVYRARDRELDRGVALKALRHADAGAAVRERFLREARLAARLAHPNIMPVYETGIHEGRPFYTMPLVEGPPLRPPLPPHEAFRIMAAVARAAAWSHAHGVIHRDLKPGNILLRGGEPVITDFGVARDPREGRITETGELIGTPAYMSPEQVRGYGGEADGKADVYALGVILHELLTGNPPFEATSFLELSSKVLNNPVPELVGFAPEVAALLKRCLAKRPGDRPDAAELARRLEALRRPCRRPATPALLAFLGAALLWAGADSAPEGAGGPMVRIPPGTYETGDPRFGRRRVTLDEFWIDRLEAPSRATGFTYHEALSSCLRQGKRLPTEEEWEVAAGGRLFPWGNDPDSSRAACEGRRGANPRDESPYGCRDMAGNVAEWTAGEARRGPEFRVIRGGHWQAPIENCTTFEREEAGLTRRPSTAGYRCASSRAVSGSGSR